MTNSPSAIPGAFNFQSARRDSGSAPRLSGVKSNLYQPPRTPVTSASSSLILTRSTTSIISMNTSLVGAGQRPATKKRTLNDYNDVEPPRMTDDWEKESHGRAEGWVPASPKPFVNTRYQLAGGMDTPTVAANYREDEGAYAETGYRRSLSDMEEMEQQVNNRRDFEGPSYFPLEREANGRGRGYPDQRSNGWGKGAISVVGAVVGKAIDFCRASATLFTGFKAGGGQAYQVNDFGSVSRFEAVENEHNWESEKQGHFGEREGTPVPGRFPDEDFIPDYMDHPTPDDSPVRPSKRRQVSGGFRDEEIAKNWVVVPTVPARATPPPAQPRPLPRPSIRPNLVSRHSMGQTSRPASRAGFGSTARRSVAPRPSHAGSPALNPNRGASFASPRSPAPPSRIPRASPMRDVKRNSETSAEIEARHWKAMKKREEREADESIRRLDAQLKAMIREGKEALGTKVEVLDEDL